MAEINFHGLRWELLESAEFPTKTLTSSVIGIVGTAPLADADAFPLNTPVLIAGDKRLAAKLRATAGADEGTLPAALDEIFDQGRMVVVVVRVAVGADDDETMANVAGGVSGSTYTGVHALRAAKTVTGVHPRILIATGWTHQRIEDPETPGTYLLNPVAAALKVVTPMLRGFAYIDGPNAGFAAALDVRDSLGGRDMAIVDMQCKRYDAAGEVVTRPLSACVAGLRARIDNEFGFWHSCSNHEIRGIIGLSRPMPFEDPADEGALLGNENINVAIRDDGFRYWGGLTCSSDSKYKFETTVRIYTMVMDSLLDARRRLADRPFTANVVKQIIRSCDSYIRTLQSREALIAGRCFADPDLNTSDRVMLGKAYFNLDLTVPTPMHDVTFGLTLGTDGYDSIFEV